MSSFIIPTSDPGSPNQQTYPDVIRGSTVEGFLLRDRFAYAYSRRILTSVPNYSTTATGLVTVYGGYLYPMALGTGGIWIVASGERGTVDVQIGTTTHSYTFGTSFETWSLQVAGAITPGVAKAFQIKVTKTTGQPYVNLYGVSIYEERLTTYDLP